MSFGEDLLVILSGYSRGYRLMRARMHGYTGPALPQSARERLQAKSEGVLRVTLYRLKKKGLVENNRGLWKITKTGLMKLAGRKHPPLPRHSENVSSQEKKRRRSMIIAFDIPEKERHKRNWLRTELAGLGFEMLQKSVWFGPAPLPRQLIENLNHLKLLQHLKFFEAREADIVSGKEQ